MSRIGRVPVVIPNGVQVKVSPDNEVTVTGPKGELHRRLNSDMQIKVEDGKVTVSRPDDDREHRALHGLSRTLVANMIEGVSKGFQKGLEVTGVGYRAEKSGNNLILRVGYSHPVEVTPMPGTSFAVEGANRIKVLGIDKEIVGQMTAKIREVRPPDHFKGKGVRYAGETVRLKAGKAGKAVGRKGK